MNYLRLRFVPVRLIFILIAVIGSTTIFALDVPTTLPNVNSYIENGTGVDITSWIKLKNNIGAYSTTREFRLPHANPYLPKTLELTYSTSQNMNYGMGVGWSWKLPGIRKVENHPRTSLLYFDSLGQAELAKVPNSNNWKEIEVTRFLTVTSIKNGYKAVYPSGKVLEFNQDGLIVKWTHRFNQDSIVFDWDGQRLLQKVIVKGRQASRVLSFNYKTDIYLKTATEIEYSDLSTNEFDYCDPHDFPYDPENPYYNPCTGEDYKKSKKTDINGSVNLNHAGFYRFGRWYYTQNNYLIAINYIDERDPSDKKLALQVRFEYDLEIDSARSKQHAIEKGYLKKITHIWDEFTTVTFKADYAYEPKLKQTEPVRNTYFSDSGQKDFLVFQTREKASGDEYYDRIFYASPFYHGGGFNEIAQRLAKPDYEHWMYQGYSMPGGYILPIDLNGDSITDYLSIQARRFQGRIRNSSGFGGHRHDVHGHWGEFKVLAYLGKEGSRLRFARAPQWDLGESFNPLNFSEQVRSTQNVAMNKTVLFADQAMLTGDFDGNGLSDYLVCGDKKGLAYNTHSGFIKKSRAFTCSKWAYTQDVNGDGLSDIVDYNRVLLGDPTHSNSFRAMEVIPEAIKQIQSKLKDRKTVIFDASQDGIAEAHHRDAEFWLYDPGLNGEYEVYSGGIKKPYRNTYQPNLLSRFSVEFGGSIDIEYDQIFGRSVVSKISASNENQNTTQAHTSTVRYEYKNPIRDLKSNKFLGFKSILRFNEGNQDDYIEYLEYVTDTLDVFNLVRPIDTSSLALKRSCPYRICTSDESSSVVEGSKFHLEKKYNFSRKTLNNSDIGIPGSTREHFHFYLNSASSAFMDPNLKRQPRTITENSFERYTELGPFNYKRRIIEPSGVTRVQSKSYQLMGGVKLLASESKESEDSLQYNRHDIKYASVSLSNPIGFTKRETWSQQTSNFNHEVQSFKETQFESGLPVKEVAENWFNKSYQYGNLGFLKEFQSGDLAPVVMDPNYFYQVEDLDIGSLDNRYYRYDNLGRLNRAEINDQVIQFRVRRNHCFEKYVTSVNDDAKLKSKDCVDGFGYRVSNQSEYDEKDKSFQSFQNDVFGRVLKSSLPQDSQSSRFFSETTYSYRGKPVKESNPFYTKTYNRYFTENGDGYQMSFENTPIDPGIGYSWSESSSFEFGKRSSYEAPLLSITSNFDHAGNHNAINADFTDQAGTTEKIPFKLNIRSDDLQSLGNTGGSKSFKTDYIWAQGKAIGEEARTYQGEEISRIRKNKDGSIASIRLNDRSEIIIGYDELGRETSRQSQYFKIDTEYNKRDTVISKSYNFDSHSISVNFDRDHLGRTKTLTLTNGQKTKSIDIDYIRDQIQKTDYFTISRDQHFYPSRIRYSNLKLDLHYNELGILDYWTTGKGNEEDLELNKCGKVSNIKTTQNLSALKNGTPRVGSFEYFNCGPLKASPVPLPNKDSLERITDFNMNYAGNSLRLSSIGSQTVKYYDREVVFSVGDYHILESNLHFYKDHLTYYFEDSGKTIGAYILGPTYKGFYPIVSDYLNSVRQIYDPRSKLIVDRVYGAWGEVGETIKDQSQAEVAELIQKSYSALTSLPSSKDLLLSRTRVYVPSSRRWNTVDPQKVWNTSWFFENYPGDFEGFSYSKNDPTNFLDPSGYQAKEIAFAIGVAAMTYRAVERIGEDVNKMDRHVKQTRESTRNLMSRKLTRKDKEFLESSEKEAIKIITETSSKVIKNSGEVLKDTVDLMRNPGKEAERLVSEVIIEEVAGSSEGENDKE